MNPGSRQARDNESKLIYIADPLCSWCYGFAPVIKQIREVFDSMDFEVIMGGLRPFGRETMLSLKEFLSEHWSQVERRSGQPFRRGILDRTDLRYDTEPASRAVVTVRSLNRSDTLRMLERIQRAFYFENQDPTSEETFLHLVKELALDVDQFKERFRSDEMKKKTIEDFKRSRQLGIGGFPSTLISHQGQIIPISHGYAVASKLQQRIDAVFSAQG